jgi:hypothetical protein
MPCSDDDLCWTQGSHVAAAAAAPRLTGLQLALPDDWCVDSQNQADPNVICSTAAPLCDAGYSGKCVALPEESTKPLSSGPSELMTRGGGGAHSAGGSSVQPLRTASSEGCSAQQSSRAC